MSTSTEPATDPAAATAAATADEDCSNEFAPVVQLAKVETKTGEEDEEVIFKMRSKLFRFSKERKEWLERGTGDVRLLQHKETKKVRLLMRREKTLKICLNHFVNPAVDLCENVGSDRSWVWNAIDYADGEASEDLLAIRFKDSKNAGLFKEAYDNAQAIMKDLIKPAEDGEGKSNGEVKEDTTTAEEKEGEEKAEEEAKPAEDTGKSGE